MSIDQLYSILLFGNNSDSVYLTLIDEDLNEHIVTYSQFEKYLLSFTHYFMEKMPNISDNDVIAILPRNNLISILTIFYCLRNSIKLLFIDPDFPIRRQNTICKDIKISARIVSELKDKISHDHLLLSLDEMLTHNFAEKSILKVKKNINLDQTIIYMPTSGTTANSKIVSQSLGNLLNNAKSIGKHLNLTTSSVFLGCLPISHVNGLHLSVIANFLYGGHLVLSKSFDFFTFEKIIFRFKPNYISVVPIIIDLICKYDINKIPSSVKAIITAAAPLSRKTSNNFYQKYGIRIIQGYGLSETTNMSTMIPLNITDAVYFEVMLDSDIPSIGIELSCNSIQILDVNKDECQSGKIGELHISGTNVMNGYFNTKANEKPRWFATGDLGYYKIIDNEKYFFLTGRIKNICKVNGMSVSLDELENCVLEFEGIRDVVANIYKHELFGESIVILYTSDVKIIVEDLMAYLRMFFSSKQLAIKLLQIEEIPRTKTGKPKRRDLSIHHLR